MRHRLKTLRFKLILLHFIVYCVILVIFGFLFVTIREDDLRTNFDNRMFDYATAVADRISLNRDKTPQTQSTDEKKIRIIPYNIPGYFIQLRSVSGEIIEKSRNLEKTSLPFSEEGRSVFAPEQPIYETLEGEDALRISGEKGQLRLMTCYYNEEGMAPFHIQIAADQESINRTITRLRRLTIIIVITGFLLVAFGSWFITRRSLSPIEVITKEAQRLGAAHLDQRLTIPPGEDDVAELVRTLNGVLDRLEKAFRVQETFLANAAHELKTPVSVVLGEAQVISQKTRTSDEYGRFVTNVQDEMRHFSQIVNSMLILARADAGLPPSAFVPLSVNEVVMEAVKRCQIQAQQKEVHLTPLLAMPDKNRPEPMVDGDSELLRSAVINLIQNAIRYSPPQKSVDITVKIVNNLVRIGVRDTGHGVSDELVEQLFDRFYSGAAEDGVHKGVGLGLAIVKGVTELHKGKTHFYNHPEGGTEFVIELPLSATEEIG